MAARLQEIRAAFLSQRWRPPDGDSDFVIANATLIGDGGERGERIAILGDAPPDELIAQVEYRWFGHWQNDQKFGKQFKFKSFCLVEPHSRDGVIKYLVLAPGVGNAIAQALWNKYQSDAVSMLRERPQECAANIRGFPTERAKAAAAYLRDQQALEGCTIDLMDLLAGRGFPKNTAKECVARWGNQAPAVIRADCYKLMQFRGIGFLKTDKLYCELHKHNPRALAKLKRQAYCAAYAVIADSDKTGNTWSPVEIALAGIKANVAGVDAQPERAIQLAVRGKILAERFDNANGGDGSIGTGRRWLSDIRKAEAERYIAGHVADAAAEDSFWPIVEAAAEGQPGPTPHQAEHLSRACGGIIGLLTGKPGTGKTYLVAALVRAIIRREGQGCVAIAAPTGKAAVRCTEALNSYGIPLQASTIHRMLGVASCEGGGWTFNHNEHCPLSKKFLIIDEVSMISTSLMRHLLAARAKGTHLLLVGDTNQLPPVEHGAPLRDFIAAGLPCGELTEIKRNAGSIVRACAAISEGRQFETDQELRPNDDDPKNLKLIPAGRQSAPDVLINTVTKIRDARLLDPIWDVQVVVAVNEKSPLSRKALNVRLQVELNPAGEGVEGSPFRVGDKVICTRNSFLKAHKDTEHGDEWSGQEGVDPLGPNKDEEKHFVANGDIGRVIEVHEKKTIVEFFSPTRRVMIPRGRGKQGDDDTSGDESDSGTGCDLDLAYSVTCHKCQGSSAKCVIVALDEYPGATGPYGVCKREWIYTAASRAEKICLLIGKMSTAYTMMRDVALPKRKTFLVELLAERALESVLMEAGGIW